MQSLPTFDNSLCVLNFLFAAFINIIFNDVECLLYPVLSSFLRFDSQLSHSPWPFLNCFQLCRDHIFLLILQSVLQIGQFVFGSLRHEQIRWLCLDHTVFKVVAVLGNVIFELFIFEALCIEYQTPH